MATTINATTTARMILSLRIGVTFPRGESGYGIFDVPGFQLLAPDFDALYFALVDAAPQTSGTLRAISVRPVSGQRSRAAASSHPTLGTAFWDSVPLDPRGSP